MIDLKEFLNSNQGGLFINRIVKCIKNHIIHHPALLVNIQKILGENYNIQTVSGGDAVGEDDLLEKALKSELQLFLIKNEKQVSALVSNPKGANLLCICFINKLKDKIRSKKGDPYSFFRKYVIDTLRRTDRFNVSQDKNSKKITLSQSETKQIAPLTDSDLKEISFPYDRIKNIDFDSIRNQKDIYLLAETFLCEISKKIKQPNVKIFIDDFIKWLTFHIKIPESSLSSLSVQQQETDDSEPQDIDIPDENNRPDAGVDLNFYVSVAETFVAQLDSDDRHIAFLKWVKNEKLENIAKSIGSKSPATASYRIKKVEDKLRSHIREIDFISPGNDYDEKELLKFFDVLLEILKKVEANAVYMDSDNV